MKKLILVILLSTISTILVSQIKKRTQAFEYHSHGKLDLAKGAIDEAIKDSVTINDAKTWFYRGNIYYDIAVSPYLVYQMLNIDPFTVAYNSYLQAQHLDVNGEFTADIQKCIASVGNGYYDLGVMNYNEQKYSDAALNFEKSYTISQSINRIDTSALLNMALSASQGNDKILSKKYYQEAVSIGVKKPDIYLSLAEIYISEGDTNMAFQLITKGRGMSPDDLNLRLAEINIYISNGENENALAGLEDVMNFYKYNASVFYNAGTIYDQIGESKKAEACYLQAIELSPDYFEPIYNIGAHYINQAANIVVEANIQLVGKAAEYENAIQRANNFLILAIPFLEKALDLKPDDVIIMVSLKEIYTRLGMTEKLQSINDKLKN